MGYCAIYNERGETFDGVEFSHDCPVAFSHSSEALIAILKLKSLSMDDNFIIGYYSQYEDDPFKI